MFQRLKGAIDSRIAEEQARAKAAAVPTRTASNSQRTASLRNQSPSKRTRTRPKVEDDGSRGPDPSEFEAAFVIEDDSEEPSRVGTPIPAENKPEIMDEKASNHEATTADGTEAADEKAEEATPKPEPPAELPADVRAKLRKLEKLESRYQELLRSYRIAHARAISIEPFEKSLKENTPLTSISEPSALVEYLNQLNLRGDMVMDELRRVTTDRDDYKKKFEDAEKATEATRKELEAAKSAENGTPLESKEPTTPTESRPFKPETTVKSPVSSVLGIFSPKLKTQPSAEKSAENEVVGESFFSYDDEIPRLQSDLKAKTSEIDQLRTELRVLKENLDKAKGVNGTLSESLQSLEKQLSDAKNLNNEKASKAEIVGLQEKLDTTTKALRDLEMQVVDQEREMSDTLAAKVILSNDLDTLRIESSSQLEALRLSTDVYKAKIKDLELQLGSMQDSKGTDAETVNILKHQIESMRVEKGADEEKIKALEQGLESLNAQLKAVESEKVQLQAAIKGITPTNSEAPPSPDAPITSPSITGPKKKNKKKKKGGAPGGAVASAKPEAKDDGPESSPIDSTVYNDLLTQITILRGEVISRDVQIEKLQSKRKTEEDLREEVENMQENLLNIGQEHVEARERIKELQAEKRVLEDKVASLELEVEAQKDQSKSAGKIEEELKRMAAEYEELKVKSVALQSDLGAAQQLATSRYKDLTDLKDILQKAQPELKSLRSENANLKSTKDDLAARTAELRRLESREKDLKSDLTSFKKQAADRDSEIRSLNEKITQETNGRLKAEDQARISARDLRRAEIEKIELAATGEKATRELKKVQDETAMLRTVVQELEAQVSKLTFENQGFREEIDLKNSQYTSAQSLVGSMRDQTAEMATQLKEAKDQAESLEEELGEVQRLLSERTREGETMRRLLSDIDDKADAKVREMRERLEAAIEERDRAEDEASTNGRRRAREIEDLKNKIRDMEREVKRANDDRDELERSAKEWKRRRDEVEKASETAVQEMIDLNTAMEELRNALDTSEKQARDAEKQKMDLRRMLDDSNQKYEKLQKTLKIKQQRLDELSSTSSPRSSIDGSSVASRPNGSANGMMDYVYLKTVLLQFLEQRDKKLQTQLVPVLGKLLHFDKKDEQKWIAAISVK